MKNLNFEAANKEALEYGLKTFKRANGDFVVTNRSGKSVFTFNNEGEVISKRSCYDSEIRDISLALNKAVEITEAENTWLIDGEETKNNLNYSEMYAKYGMDFK